MVSHRGHVAHEPGARDRGDAVRGARGHALGHVNVAAKLQALAEGHQVAISEATYQAPGVAELLADAALEQLEYTSKALPEPVKVRRWNVFPVGQD